jgi:hypothetical protein
MDLLFSSMGFAVLKGAAIGFCSGIIIVLAMRKWGLFARDGKIHAAIVKLYYLYIPLALTALCLAWFGVSAVRTEALSLVSLHRSDIVNLSVNAAELAEGKIRDAAKGAAVLESDLPSIARVIAASVDEAFAAKLRSYPSTLRNLISEALTKQVLDLLALKLSEATGLPPDSLEAVLVGGIIASFRGGLFAEIAEAQLHRVFEGFLAKIRMVAIILFLPVLFEMGFSSYTRKRGRKRA